MSILAVFLIFMIASLLVCRVILQLKLNRAHKEYLEKRRHSTLGNKQW